MCIVFTLNGQRHDGLDNSFIVNELKMKYLRKRMIIVVDLDGLSHEASAEIIQGSRSGLFKGAVYDEIQRKLTATLAKDPDLQELEEQAEDELAHLQTGDIAVQNALDQLIDQHFSKAERLIEGSKEQGGRNRAFFSNDGTPVTVSVVTFGENGLAAELPVLVSNRESSTIRLKPNKDSSIVLKSHPVSDWSSLNDLAVLIDPQIPGLTHQITRDEGSAEVTLSFKEPEDFSTDEYPLEATLSVIGKFKEKNEPRLLEKAIEIRPSRPPTEPPKPPKLNDQPTHIRVASRQPVRLHADGADTHVRLSWDGKDYLVFEPSPLWTFSAVCTSHQDFPTLTFTKPTNGRFAVLVSTPKGFLVGTKLEFSIVARGPDNAELTTGFIAVVVEPPGPRTWEKQIQLNGQRRPPYDLRFVTEKVWEESTRWGDSTWSEEDAAAFIEPSNDRPLILCINEDFGLLRELIAKQIEEKKAEERTEEKKTRYISHIAFHLYQMYLGKEGLLKKQKEDPESDIKIPSDEEMQAEIDRVASTLIKLMQIMR
jgi:hypothetical protein